MVSCRFQILLFKDTLPPQATWKKWILKMLGLNKDDFDWKHKLECRWCKRLFMLTAIVTFAKRLIVLAGLLVTFQDEENDTTSVSCVWEFKLCRKIFKINESSKIRLKPRAGI